MSETVTETRRLFAEAVAQKNSDIDLGRAALLIAQEEYEHMHLEGYLRRLDDLADELKRHVDLAGGTRKVAQGLGAYLGLKRGFRGDDENYYDVRNTYLNKVLERGLGTPVSLGILYIEVARRVGVNLEPVAFPSHFLLLLRGRRGERIYIDPYNEGRLLDIEGCRRLLADLYANSREFSETLIAPGTRRQVLGRILADLRFIYLRENNLRKAIRTIDLILTLSPWDLDQIRDRGLLLSRLGNYERAIPDLTAFLDHAPPGTPVDGVRETLRRISRA